MLNNMAPSKSPVLSKSRARSRVTNGKSLLPKGVDGRSLWFRRFRDLNTLHLSEIPNASEGEKAIIRRSATLIVALEQMEFKFADAGEASPNQLDQYARIAAQLRRLLESVGLERRTKDAVPSLQEYLASKRHRVVVDHEDDD